MQCDEACVWGGGEAGQGEQRPDAEIVQMVLLTGEEHENISGRFVGEDKLSLEYPSGGVQKKQLDIETDV